MPETKAVIALTLCGFAILYAFCLISTGGFLWNYHYKQNCYSYFDTDAVYTNARIISITNETVRVLYSLGEAVIIPIEDAYTKLYTTDYMNTNTIKINLIIPITYLKNTNADQVFYGRVYDVWLEFMLLARPFDSMFVLALIETMVIIVIGAIVIGSSVAIHSWGK